MKTYRTLTASSLLMVLFFSCLFLSADPLSAAARKNAGEKNGDRLTASGFLDLKFGMFIHFNMETYKKVQWVEGYADPSEFNPGKKIDTDAWAEAAAAAGMKYAVLTVKHVSGFCLWDSRYTEYDIMHPDCPYQRDLVAQFIKSFQKKGLKVGLYYCWRNEGFDAKYKVLPPECDPATHSLQEQIEFQKAQITELMLKYPEAFYIWNDGLDASLIGADEIAPFFKMACPGLLVSNNWWDWSRKGTPYMDIAITEMRHFKPGSTAVGETCWTLEDGWFWNGDSDPMTAEQVLRLKEKVNGNHANLLLNVGPDTQGKFQESSIAVLKEIGQALDKTKKR